MPLSAFPVGMPFTTEASSFRSPAPSRISYFSFRHYFLLNSPLLFSRSHQPLLISHFITIIILLYIRSGLGKNATAFCSMYKVEYST